eukprot:CAMPEP_0194319106 /NCGR_PEP_ID=MMETSP0171-20130528/15609_1 /TAXON_ID=218684 /ORGANISM="Corethron pennatum, Strain L29A3" /LENGTH=362 /DNA_ID=CAMNT_0039076207 /DNA_START=35 /DNA_END=1123 /DNA_ORIENTATION=-
MTRRSLSVFHVILLASLGGNASAFGAGGNILSAGSISITRATLRQSPLLYRSPSPLKMSASDELIVKRRKRVEIGYATSVAAWTGLVAAIAGRAVQSSLSGAATPTLVARLAYTATLWAVTLAVAAVALDAAGTDRISSEPLRFLNFGLLGQSALNLVACAVSFAAIKCGMECPPLPAPLFVLAWASFLTAVPAFKGWWYGTRGWGTGKSGGRSAMTADALRIVRGSLSLPKISGWNSAGYLAVTVFAGCLKLTTATAVYRSVVDGAGPFWFAGYLIRLSNYSLISLVAFALQKESSGGTPQMKGANFAQLNFALAVALGAKAVFWNTIGAGMPLVAGAASASAFTAGNGINSLKKIMLNLY